MSVGEIVTALRVAAVTLAAGVAALVAQVAVNLDTVGSVGIVGALAVIVGRYTFRQLENYRADLQGARERGDQLEIKLQKAGDDLAELTAHNRELETYAHNLRLWVLAAGIGSDAEIPEPPGFTA